MKVLDGKVAIVTGAGQGIGRGLALALSKAGATVVVADLRADTGSAVAAEIKENGGEAIAIVCDVSNETQVKQTVQQTVDAYGTVDILINNAQALYVDYAPIEDMTEDRFNRTYDTGIKATWYFCKAVFPFMKVHGGKIINLASAWGINGAPGWSDYAGCKEAIRAFTRSAAREWGKYGINVNAICPGLDSPSAQAFVKKQQTEATEESVTKDAVKSIESVGNALRRWGEAEKDGGPVAVFLSSSASDYMTGQTFHVDGGGLITA